jgi:hypothetical protein
VSLRIGLLEARAFAFPASLPRPCLEIKEDGEFIEYVPEPTDEA